MKAISNFKTYFLLLDLLEKVRRIRILLIKVTIFILFNWL